MASRMSCFPEEGEEPMTTHVNKTARLGDLVVTVFDEAAKKSSDPREVSRLATRAITHMLRVHPSAHWAVRSVQPRQSRP